MVTHHSGCRKILSTSYPQSSRSLGFDSNLGQPFNSVTAPPGPSHIGGCGSWRGAQIIFTVNRDVDHRVHGNSKSMCGRKFLWRRNILRLKPVYRSQWIKLHITCICIISHAQVLLGTNNTWWSNLCAAPVSCKWSWGPRNVAIRC